jgi:hypothetical protein
METKLPDWAKATAASSSSEIDNNSSASEQTKRPPSIPSNMPALVIEKIGAQDEVIPINYYNWTLHPHLMNKGLKDVPMYLLGRWTFNNLPEFGAMPHAFQPIVRIQQDKSLVLQKSANTPVKTDMACCFVQKYVLAAHFIRHEDGALTL